MSKLAQEKFNAIGHWDRHGIASTSDAFGVSIPTLYRWRKLYREHGMNALEDKSKAPIRTHLRSHNWDRLVIGFIRDYRREYYGVGAHKIFRPLQAFCKEQNISCPGVSTISRIISDNGGFRIYKAKVSAKVKRPSKPVNRRPASWYPKAPGDCIAIDNIHIRMKGRKYYAITCIDLYSRLAFVSVSTSISSKTAAKFIDSVIRVFPFNVKRVLSDNGSEFKKYFEKLLENRKVTQWKIYPGKPQMNAVCERFNRTVKEGCLIPALPLLANNTAKFNEKLVDWLFWYNTERAHHGLNYNTPMEQIKNKKIQYVMGSYRDIKAS